MIPGWVAPYVGLPYRSHGRGPEYDCWGLVRLVLKEQFGLDPPDYGDKYVGDHDKIGLPKAFEEGKDGWERVEEGQAGDVVLLFIGGRVMHCGLVVAPRCMLHARTKTGSCLERFDGPVWNRRVEGIYRHRSLCN